MTKEYIIIKVIDIKVLCGGLCGGAYDTQEVIKVIIKNILTKHLGF